MRREDGVALVTQDFMKSGSQEGREIEQSGMTTIWRADTLGAP